MGKLMAERSNHRIVKWNSKRPKNIGNHQPGEGGIVLLTHWSKIHVLPFWISRMDYHYLPV